MARFLRWVGGKDEQLEHLLKRLPKPFPRRYLEPFVGGGALFFELQRLGVITKSRGSACAVLADSNERLIRCYRGVREDVAKVIRGVEKLPVTREMYLRVRDWNVDAGTDTEVAAWLIYVNHAGYGGLFRVNAKGRFNVPFDTDRNGRIWQGQDRVRSAAMALRGVDLVCGDFSVVMAAHAKANTFTYIDSPYLQERTTDFANGYTGRAFGRAEHERLATSAATARSRGCTVLASNSEIAAPLWRARGFRVELLDGGRQIGRSKGGAAPRAGEMIAFG